MEFIFDINVLLAQDITRIVGGTSLMHRHSSNKWDSSDKNFATVIDAMGAASAKAQGLHNVITTAQKFHSSNQVIYIMKDGACNNGKGAAVGIIKVGRKVLFLADMSGVLHEVEPLCVLDFYVHENRQRTGCGKKLFEAMLEAEQKKPFEVAIDRPSPKFLGFLRKHYNLQSYVKQANNFVVFDQFFSTCVDHRPSNKRYSFQKGPTFPSPQKGSTFPSPQKGSTFPSPQKGSIFSSPQKGSFPSIEPLTSPHTDIQVGAGGGAVMHLHSNRPTQYILDPLCRSLSENTSGAALTPLGSTTGSKQGVCEESPATRSEAPNDLISVASTTTTGLFGRLDNCKAPYLNMRNHGDRRRGQGTADVDWFNHSSLCGTGVPAVAKATRYSRHQAFEPSHLRPGGVPAASSLAPGNIDVSRGFQRKTWRSYIT